MGFVVFWLIVMAVAALIVLGRLRMLREDAAAGGTALGFREASRIRTLTCISPMTAAEVTARLVDGVPAGELLCTWDGERGAYCFRGELPDGSIPLYCTVDLEQTAEDTRVTLTRHRSLLKGNSSVVMRLSGFLTRKISAAGYAWTTDR